MIATTRKFQIDFQIKKLYPNLDGVISHFLLNKEVSIHPIIGAPLAHNVEHWRFDCVALTYFL